MKVLFIHHHRKHKFLFRAAHFAEKLVERGYDVTAICTSESRRFKGKEYIENGIKYLESPDLLWGRVRSGWDLWSTIYRINWIRNKKFDLIYLFETRPATIYPVIFYKRKNNIPTVIDWVDWCGRGGLVKENRPKWYQLLFGGIETFYEEKFRKIADATTIISNGLKQRAIRLGCTPESITIISNGAEKVKLQISDSHKYRDKYRLPKEAFIICDTGKDALFGVEWIFNAMIDVLKKDPDVFFIMTGSKREYFSRLSKRMVIQNHFIHFGFMGKNELLEILSCADIFVVPFEDKPANWGRWPGKIGKYLSLGKPIVTNPVGAMKSVISENNVGIFSSEDPKDLAEKILFMKKNPIFVKRLGNNARKYAETKLDWDILTDKVVCTFEFALEKNRKEE